MNQNNQSPLSLIQYGVTKNPKWVSVGIKAEKMFKKSQHIEWTEVAMEGHMQAKVIRGQKPQVSRKSQSVRWENLSRAAERSRDAKAARSRSLKNLFSSGSSTKSVYASLYQNSLWPPHTHQKPENNKCWWGCGEIGTLVHCWWVCKMVQPLWKTVWQLLKKIKHSNTIHVIHQFHFWVYMQKKWKQGRDTHTPMFIAALFTIAQGGSNPSVYPQMNG